MMLSENWPYNGFMTERTPRKNFTEHGKRLAELRKAAGLSQMEVAKELGIPQRTISFYEREARQVPQHLVKPLAELFGVAPEIILGLGEEPQKKRGPKSKLERLCEKATHLPQAKQDLIIKLLGEIIGNHA
jgi:transcriptional regulator with XRE-family HTH domain